MFNMELMIVYGFMTSLIIVSRTVLRVIFVLHFDGMRSPLVMFVCWLVLSGMVNSFTIGSMITVLLEMRKVLMLSVGLPLFVVMLIIMMSLYIVLLLFMVVFMLTTLPMLVHSVLRGMLIIALL